MRFPRLHLPKFSLGDVLLVTAAAAVAMAVVTTKKSSFDGLGFFLGNEGERMGLLFFAALLLALSLGRQAWQLGRALPSVPLAARAHGKLALWSHLMITAGIIAAAIVVLLINRELVDGEIHVERDWQGTALWKTTIPIILTLLAARRLADPPRETRSKAGWLRIVRRILLPGVVLAYGVTMLGQIQMINVFIHIATQGVELAHPARWHRPGTFPNHMLEGYFTARMVLAATSLWLIGVGSLWGASRQQSGVRRLSLFAIVLLSSAAVAAFNWWYAAVEFPRVSPDLAAAPSTLAPWGIAGYALLCLGIAHAWGLTAARRSAIAWQNPEESTPLATIPLRRNWLVTLGGLLVALFSLWSLVEQMFILDSFMSIFSSFSLSDFLEVFAYMFWMPEEFLKLLLIPFGLALAWQSFRRGQRPLELAAVRYRDYLVHLAGAFVLLAVGLPCLRAFGFALWLCPDWAFF